MNKKAHNIVGLVVSIFISAKLFAAILWPTMVFDYQWWILFVANSIWAQMLINEYNNQKQ